MSESQAKILHHHDLREHGDLGLCFRMAAKWLSLPVTQEQLMILQEEWKYSLQVAQPASGATRTPQWHKSGWVAGVALGHQLSPAPERAQALQGQEQGKHEPAHPRGMRTPEFGRSLCHLWPLCSCNVAKVGGFSSH